MDSAGSAVTIEPRPRNSALLWIALGLTLLTWASAFAAIKVGLVGYAPNQLALFRFMVASATIALYAVVAGVRFPARRDWPTFAAAAVAGIPVYHMSLNHAEVTIGAGPAALLMNTSPVMAALMAATVLRERLGVQGWIGTLVSFAGAVLIAARDGFTLSPGALWVLLAALGGAIYTVLQKPALRRYTAVEFSAWAIWLGTAAMLPALPGLIAQLRFAPASSTLAAVYLGVFPAAAAYVLWARVASSMNVSRAVSFLYLVPLLAVLIAWLWLGEIPALLALVGGAMVVGGVVLVNTRRQAPVTARPEG